MKYLILLTIFLTGCNAVTAVKAAKVVKDIGCITTTEEGRAEIREKQRLKTNVCGDELK